MSDGLPARNYHLADDRPALALPPVLDLIRADALHAELQACMSRDEALRIDGSAVELVSTACLQVLVAAARAAQARERTFELMSPSHILGNAARDLGLAACLGLAA